MRALVLTILVACASVDGPVEQGRARDRADEARVSAQLAQLPGVQRASVVIERPVADPLSNAKPGTPHVTALIVVDGEAERPRVTAASQQLLAALEIAPTLIVDVGRPPPELVDVGPFTVEAHSRTPLRITLAAALFAIAALGALLARARMRRTPERKSTEPPAPTSTVRRKR